MLAPASGVAITLTFDKKMKETDDTLWGKSKWSARDLDRKRLDCSINTLSKSISGVAEIFAKERPGGEICVEIRYSESTRPHSKRYAIIHIPPALYDRMEPHADPSVADFHLAD